MFVSDGESDRTRSCPNVEDARLIDVAKKGETALDYDLRLRTRDERAPVDSEHEPPEPPLSENVRKRLAAYAPLHEGTQLGILLLVESHVRRVQLRAREAEHVGDEVLRVHARRGDAGFVELARDVPNDVERDQAVATASKARRRSSAASASVKSSSSPPRIPSRRWSVSFVRWSVTRFSGKL